MADLRHGLVIQLFPAAVDHQLQPLFCNTLASMTHPTPAFRHDSARRIWRTSLCDEDNRYCDFHAGQSGPCNILVTGVGNRMLPDHRFPVVLADDNLLVFQNNTQKLRFQKLTDIRNIEHVAVTHHLSAVTVTSRRSGAPFSGAEAGLHSPPRESPQSAAL